ncbi:serine/threonine-protein kinase [Marinobacter fonticola]|uniref:serine/threonine-protein kinase n=1 Tax=Marinobacter fonticola TaxID=2603215 RepID=UPI001D0D8643|nr:serine/threonine-protein kinase [Marinobacter fonticola]
MIDGLLLCGVLLLTLGIPALGTGLAVLVTGLMGAGLVVGQAIMLLYQKIWLPLGDIYALLGPGLVAMLFWMQPYRQIRDLRQNVLKARYQLGRLLLQQGQADDALVALADCPPSNQTLELQYDIAIQQERKRQYDAAARTYSQIANQRKGFRDVKNRLQALEKISTGATGTGTAAPITCDATSTLVLPDASVSKPTLGRYEIDREIGRGAMGVVYLGQDPKIARRVAIKTFSYAQFEGAELKELKSRFYREAEAAGRLNHPAIVTVYDVGEEADLAFIAMDYADGKPLSAYSRRDRLLQLPVVLDVLARVADALDYAHRQKIVHRDIKPGNIIYDARSGDVKITDFGIAKIADDSRTRTGSVMGSPLYMSPEQLKGQRIAGTSDVYSLGVTLYKLASGETPFNADTLANLTYQILNKRPRSVREFNPDLPDGVIRLINKAIQRDPSKRFASAGAMAEALRRAAVRKGSKEAS